MIAASTTTWLLWPDDQVHTSARTSETAGMRFSSAKQERRVAVERPPANQESIERVAPAVVTAAGVGAALLLGCVFRRGRSAAQAQADAAVAGPEGGPTLGSGAADADDSIHLATSGSPTDDLTARPLLPADAPTEVRCRSAAPVHAEAPAARSSGYEPAPPAARQRLYEGRRTPRVPLAVTGVLLWRGGSSAVTVLDISDDRLRCQLHAGACNDPLPKQPATVVVSLSILGDREVAGRIMWRRLSSRGEHQFGIAVRSAEDRDLLLRACAAGGPSSEYGPRDWLPEPRADLAAG